MYDPVVSSTDGSEHADRAAVHALGLAGTVAATVEVGSDRDGDDRPDRPGSVPVGEHDRTVVRHADVPVVAVPAPKE